MDDIFSPDRGDNSQRDNIVILITDGWSDDPDDTWAEAMRLREAGIHIIVVGIGSSIRPDEIKGKRAGMIGNPIPGDLISGCP